MDKDQILDSLAIEDIYGSDLKKNTKGFTMRCPFHHDTDPSFQVYDDTKSFNCFGCGVGGSAYDFIMKRDGVEFYEALKTLADKAGVNLQETRHPYARLFEINKAVQQMYSGFLVDGSEALKYLVGDRKLSQKTIERFRLGCTNDVSVVASLKSMGFTDDEIVSAGVGYRKDKEVRDLFRGRIMFPIIRNGKVLGFGGRIFGKTEGPKYLNTPASPIFQKKTVLYGLDQSAIKEKGFAMVVEGYLDVIICHHYGFKNAVSPLGTAFSEEHVELLRKYTDTIVPVFDGDAAGQIAAERSVKLLFDQRMKGSVATLPAEEDPDSFLRKGGDLDELIGNGMSFGCFLAEKFPATKKMIFTSLLFRSSYDAAEYVAHMDSPDDAKTLMQLNARKMIEELVQKAPAFARQKDIEVRKYKDFLVLISKKRFILWEKIKGNPKTQAEAIMVRFIEIKRKHFGKSGENSKR